MNTNHRKKYYFFWYDIKTQSFLKFEIGLYRCGPGCNSDSGDDCTSQIALYEFSGVTDCSNTPSLYVGFETDSGDACPNAPVGRPFPFYRVEVDCPIQL